MRKVRDKIPLQIGRDKTVILMIVGREPVYPGVSANRFKIVFGNQFKPCCLRCRC